MSSISTSLSGTPAASASRSAVLPVVALALRGTVPLAFQLLIYPVADRSEKSRSYHLFKDGFFLSDLQGRITLFNGSAERLLGNGDMLFLSPGTSQILRGQGTYLSDDEIGRVMLDLEAA